MTAFAITDNLDWEVEQRPLYYPNKDGQLVRYSDRVAIVRSDNEFPLGVVSSGYETVQNKDLLKVIEPMVAEGVLTIENIGYLNNGAKVFAQSRISQDFRVAGEDYKAFLTLLNGHVGNNSVAIGPSTIRVICNNTFAMSYSAIDTKFRHSEGVNERVLETKEILNYIDSAMSAYRESSEKLAVSSCSAKQFNQFLEGVYDREISKMRDSLVDRLNYLFRNGKGNEGKTFYDAINAITEYNSHESRTTEQGRFNYVNFGRGSSVSLRALDVAKELAAV